MEETQEASQPSEESVITDEMLDRAADGVDEVEEVATEDETTEETVEEEATEVAEEVAEEETEEVVDEEAEVDPEEPEDNAERSRLGRRVSELQDELRQSKLDNDNKLNETLEKLNSFLGKNEEPEEEELFELPETKGELAKLIKDQLAEAQNEEVTQKTEAVKSYESGYIDTVESLLDGEADAKEIYDLINSDEFNVKHSKVDNLQNGVKDAAKNIMAARSKLQGTTKKIPLKGEKPRAPLGGGGGDKIPVASKKRPKLDATAEQYVKDTNMSDDAVIEMFG